MIFALSCRGHEDVKVMQIMKYPMKTSKGQMKVGNVISRQGSVSLIKQGSDFFNAENILVLCQNWKIGKTFYAKIALI